MPGGTGRAVAARGGGGQGAQRPVPVAVGETVNLLKAPLLRPYREGRSRMTASLTARFQFGQFDPETKPMPWDSLVAHSLDQP